MAEQRSRASYARSQRKGATKDDKRRADENLKIMRHAKTAATNAWMKRVLLRKPEYHANMEALNHRGRY